MESKMQIYIATPVNGRKEKTLAEKRAAAYERVKEMVAYLRRRYPDVLFVSGFTVYPLEQESDMRESYVMGCCVRLVMESDMVVMDETWRDSRGCWVEHEVAKQYDIPTKSYQRMKLNDKLK